MAKNIFYIYIILYYCIKLLSLSNFSIESRDIERNFNVLNKPKTTQCRSIAKSSKKRCKKMTTNLSGYCNSHGIK
jgi:hypothetical protein